MPPSSVSAAPDGLLAKQPPPIPAKVDVEQHPPAGLQDRSVLQRTGNRCRLLSLPASTLYDIARRAGPRARRLCHALRDAYGPLDNGLRLPDPTCPDTALALLAHHHPNLRRITHLSLPPMPLSGTHHTFDALLPAICSTLPSLCSLSLPPDRPMADHHLVQLAPLAARLSALSAQLLSSPSPGRTPLHPLPHFTQLSSLTLSCHAPPPGPETQAWLASLAALPQLAHLSLFHLPTTEPPDPHSPFTRLAAVTPHAFDSSWIPGLAAATPRLTSLSLGALPVAWTQAAAAALTHGFPHLTHLFLMHALEPPTPAFPDPAGPAAAQEPLFALPPGPQPPAALDLLAPPLDDDVGALLADADALDGLPGPCAGAGMGALAALAHRRSPLRSSELQLFGAAGTQHLEGWGAARLDGAVPQLSRLTAVLQGLSRRQAAWLWGALSQQTALTSLRVSCSGTQLPSSFLQLPGLPSLPSTLVELQLGWHWDPGPLVACLLQLSCLRVLGLHRDEFMSSRWPPEAVARLSSLTQLESLTLTEQMLPSKLLHSISHLTRLRSLTLTESTDCYPRLLTVSDADLGHLRPLHACLTSLELAGMSGVRGGGLRALRELTQLQRLTLCALRALPRQDVHRFLLPLPPALTVLQILDTSVATSPRNSLVAAAHRQDCRATFSPHHHSN